MDEAIDSLVIVLEEDGLNLCVVSFVPFRFFPQGLLKLPLIAYFFLVDECIVHNKIINTKACFGKNDAAKLRSKIFVGKENFRYQKQKIFDISRQY